MYKGERFNGWTHLAGLAIVLWACALILLTTLAHGESLKSVGVLVFTVCAAALYASSTLFHSTRGRRKAFWERADHCAIYLLIAGTYTPFALVAVAGPLGWGLLAVIWGGALLGIARELRPHSAKPPSLALYLGLGWLVVAAAVPLAGRLHPAALGWLVAGAALYTAGTVFYRNARGWQYAHGVWHLFVLGGTSSHLLAVARLVA